MTSIAHYNLLDSLGHGGIGDAWRARDTRVGRTVLVKLVAPAIATDPDRLARLEADATAAKAISHPNVATLFDSGEVEGQHYLAYEFAAGRPLREEMTGSPMNLRRALDLAVQIADGIADAHASGIIHGDLRPETVIVTDKGSAKILDCGLAPWTRGGAIRARAARDPDRLPPDANGVVAYLSPEQAVGGATDTRSDVFTLGVMTYEMVTGRNPFTAATPAETVINVISGRIPSASEVNRDVPADLDAILGRAMSRNIDQRHQSAASLSAELRSVAAMLDVRSGDSKEPSVLLPLDERPDKSAAGVLFALLAGAAAFGAVWWYLSRG